MATLFDQRKFYVVAFLGLFIVLFGVYSAGSDFLPAYYAALAWSVCWVLGLFDPAVSCDANYLLYDGIRELVVVEGCDGITFVALILAAIIPFPAPWRDKLIGLTWAIPTLLIANWLRLLALSAIKFYAPSGFDFFHVYVFQPVMIAFTLLVFLSWLRVKQHAPEAS